MKLINQYMNKLDKDMEEKKNNSAETSMRIPDEMLDDVVGGVGAFEFPVIEEDIPDP